MRTAEFHSEWVTIEDTRVFLQCRDGFPSEHTKFIAELAVKALKYRTSDARLVHIFYDDKAGVHCLYFVSDNPEDKIWADEVVELINGICNSGNEIGEMVIVKQGNKSSNHYNHMAYLSKQFFEKC